MNEESEKLFRNVSSPHVRACYLKTLARFPELKDNHVRLEQRQLPGYTMRAQPILNGGILHRRSRHYRVQMSDHVKISRYVRLNELPEEVLIGWFAHELGHVVDYHRKTLFALIRFIIGYLLFPTHRAGAERRADLFAIDKGFGEQLMATKIYILDQSELPDKYKARIRKHYMSPDELELILKDREAERVLF